MSNSTPRYVKADSLPRSLHHVSEDDVMYETKSIAAFLKEAGTAVLKKEASEGIPNNIHEISYGMELCFKLLQDKLDIMDGTLPFPMAAFDDKAPRLWNPDGDKKEGGA